MPYIRQILLLLFLFGGTINILAQEPTLAKLSLWVSVEHKSEYHAQYEKEILQLFERYGLKPSQRPIRSEPDSISSYLFEVDNPATFWRIKNELKNNTDWNAVLKKLGTRYGTSLRSGNLKTVFGIYTTPPGPGQTTQNVSWKGHFLNYDATDGLIGGPIWDIYQDKKRNLWFAGPLGLCKFDGQTWTKIQADKNFPLEYVSAIFEDKQGNIWIGNINRRLSKGVYRVSGEKWTTFSDKEGLVNNFVQNICQTKNGDIWFATSGGASRFDGQNWENFTTENGLIHHFVNKILQDKDDNLWFATNGGVVRFDGQKWKTFAQGPYKNVQDIIQDKDGNIWTASYGIGASKFDGKTWKTYSTKNGLTSNEGRSIIQDRDGHIWYVARNGGASRFDGKTWQNFTTKDGLVGNLMQIAYQDSEGNIWFGAENGGISKYTGYNFSTLTPSPLLRHDIWGFLKDQQGDFWMTTEGGGISHFDGTTWRTFTAKDGLGFDMVYSPMQDRYGNIWFCINILGGDWGGAIRYDRHIFTTFSLAEGLNNRVWTSYQDNDGDLWFGTLDGGVSKFDGKNWTTYTEEDGLTHNRVFSILQDHEGSFWFGTWAGGVSRFDGKNWITYSEEDGLSDNMVRTIAQDHNNHLWFGTTKGLSKFDGKTWQTFTTDDGLAGNFVESILVDQKGHLWFGSVGGGVSHFDGEVFQTLMTQDGLASNTVPDMQEDLDGTILFATTKGITRYRPPEPHPPEISINAVISNDRYTHPAKLSIPSNIDITTFEFSGISLKTRPGMMVYRYRLNGYETEWKNTREQRVEYKDLPRGKYTFEVFAVDRDLVYSKTPAQVHLTVHWPYERMGWLSALSLATILIAWQTARVILRDRRLRESNAALSTANLQIQEQTQRKSTFLSQMSHEIRTPITAIKGYVDNMLDGIGGSLNERQTRNLTRVSQNSDHLLGLVNSLLDLSKIEAGRMDVDVSAFDIAELITSCSDTVRPLVKLNVELRHNIPDNLGVAQTDQGRVRQILINLLSNALKFTEKGHVEIHAEKNQDNILSISISDTGTGIPTQDLQTIFEDFKQVKGSDTQHKGTGLGLPITKGFVELLGGHIEVKSELSKGSTFTVQIPITYEA